MAELTTEALNRMVGITAADLAAREDSAKTAQTHKDDLGSPDSVAVDKQKEDVARATFEVERVLGTLDPNSDMAAKLKNALENARASVGSSAARFGGALASVNSLVTEAARVAGNDKNKEGSQRYIDSTIELSSEARRRIDIASRHITDENLREFIDSKIDPNQEMDEQTRKRIADGIEAGMKSSPDAAGELAIRGHLSEETLAVVSTMQEAGRAKIEEGLKTATGEDKAALQRAHNSQINTSPRGLEAVEQYSKGEISAAQLRDVTIELETDKARRAEPYREHIYNALPEERKAELASAGFGTNADSLDIEKILHRNGEITDRSAWKRQRAGQPLSEQDKQDMAVMETASHVLVYSGLSEFNDLALFALKSKGRENTLTKSEQDLIDKFDIIKNPATPAEERERLALELYKAKHPELFKSVENNPIFQKNAVRSILKTFDANPEKFGIEDNPHLAELERAASKDIVARFSVGVDAMLAGDAKATEDAAKDAATGVAETAKSFGLSDGTVQTVKETTETVLSTMGSAAVSAVQTYNSVANFFSSDPKFSAEIQQQLATLDLTSLKDAQGNALAVKDADGKVDMAKVTEALKEKGIALKDVDKDGNGDITGAELLTALTKPKQQGEQQSLA